MKINNVIERNLDLIYKTIKDGKSNKEFAIKLGNNMTKLFSHSFITLDISDITLLETFYLKLFSSDNIIFLDTYLNSDNIDIMSNSINSLMILSESMNNDTDIKIKPSNSLLPIGCINNHLLVTFTCNTLCNIIGVLPDIFFDELEKENISLSDFIIKKFMTNFYNYMSKKITNIDILSDSIIESKYYKYTEDDLSVSLTEVHTPYGMMSFFGDRSSDLNNEINECKRLFSCNNNDINLLPYIKTDLYFVITCSFYTFLNIFTKLPSSSFIDWKDFKILMSPDNKLLLNISSLPNNLDKYKIRINSKIDEFIKNRNNLSSDKEYNLLKYNFILGSSMTKFTLKLSLNDISNKINILNNIINKEKIDNYLDYESNYIYTNIENISKKIFSILK